MCKEQVYFVHPTIRLFSCISASYSAGTHPPAGYLITGSISVIISRQGYEISALADNSGKKYAEINPLLLSPETFNLN